MYDTNVYRAVKIYIFGDAGVNGKCYPIGMYYEDRVDVAMSWYLKRYFYAGVGRWCVVIFVLLGLYSINVGTSYLPQDFVKTRRREIRVQTFPITSINSPTEMPVKFQSDTIVVISNLSLTDSRLNKIWQ